MPPLVTSNLDEYFIDRIFVGSGGQKDVFKATCVKKTSHINEGEYVALCRLNKSDDPVQFDSEIGILEQLNHPNIVQFKQGLILDEADGEEFYLVMEFLPGKNLGNILAGSPQRFQSEQIVGIYAGLQEALMYASTLGITHRDLKPSNIIIDSSWAPKLIDFGIATLEETSSHETSTTVIKGTYDYMAPELFPTQSTPATPADELSDIYSFGVCLYQTITGELPLPAIGNSDLPIIIAEGRFPPGTASPTIDFSKPAIQAIPGMASILSGCLAFNPRARIQRFSDIPLAQKSSHRHGRPKSKPSPQTSQTETKLRVVHQKSEPAKTDPAVESVMKKYVVTEIANLVPLSNYMERFPRRVIPWKTAKPLLKALIDATQQVLDAKRNPRIHLAPDLILLTQKGEIRFLSPGRTPPIDFIDPNLSTATHPVEHEDEVSLIYSFGICAFCILNGRLPYPKYKDVNEYHNTAGPRRIRSEALNFGQTFILKEARKLIIDCLHERSIRVSHLDSFEALRNRFSKIHRKQLGVPKHNYTYIYEEFIKKGGFGYVVAAGTKHNKTGRPHKRYPRIAIKALINRKPSERFVRESNILKEHPHPGLVKHIDFLQKESTGRPFLIMEFLSGMPQAGLDYRIRTEKHLTEYETLTIFTKYLAALQHLHDREIFHRDIKPGNMYAPAGFPEKAKLFDLGAALMGNLERLTSVDETAPQTPNYSAPEVFLEVHHGSAQSDIYGIGVSLFQALTGKLPFKPIPRRDKRAAVRLAQAKKAGDVDLPNFSQHEVFKHNARLIAIIQTALEPLPGDRYPTATAMLNEVEALLSEIKATQSIPKNLARAESQDPASDENTTSTTAPAGTSATATPPTEFFEPDPHETTDGETHITEDGEITGITIGLDTSDTDDFIKPKPSIPRSVVFTLTIVLLVAGIGIFVSLPKLTEYATRFTNPTPTIPQESFQSAQFNNLLLQGIEQRNAMNFAGARAQFREAQALIGAEEADELNQISEEIDLVARAESGTSFSLTNSPPMLNGHVNDITTLLDQMNAPTGSLLYAKLDSSRTRAKSFLDILSTIENGNDELSQFEGNNLPLTEDYLDNAKGLLASAKTRLDELALNHITGNFATDLENNLNYIARFEEYKTLPGEDVVQAITTLEAAYQNRASDPLRALIDKYRNANQALLKIADAMGQGDLYLGQLKFAEAQQQFELAEAEAKRIGNSKYETEAVKLTNYTQRANEAVRAGEQAIVESQALASSTPGTNRPLDPDSIKQQRERISTESRSRIDVLLAEKNLSSLANYRDSVTARIETQNFALYYDEAMRRITDRDLTNSNSYLTNAVASAGRAERLDPAIYRESINQNSLTTARVGMPITQELQKARSSQSLLAYNSALGILQTAEQGSTSTPPVDLSHNQIYSDVWNTSAAEIAILSIEDQVRQLRDTPVPSAQTRDDLDITNWEKDARSYLQQLSLPPTGPRINNFATIKRNLESRLSAALNEIEELLKPEEPDEPDRPNRPNITISNFEFVWVPTLRANGAYVMKHEVSAADYTRIAGRPQAGSPAASTSPPNNAPSMLSYTEATGFVAELNRIASQGNHKGTITLASPDDYFQLSGLSAVTSKRQLIRGLTQAAVTYLDSLAQRNVTWINAGNIAVPDDTPYRGTTVGEPDSNGLYNLVGNLPEWTSVSDTFAGLESTTLVRPGSRIRFERKSNNKRATVRPIFVPNQ